ncbi:hypothetical protein K402DRAFT_221307 [Aulographum hederae CBS 113979]|uniref:Uncharacterized protein n=1 Tax=Aulographum hederae CBS 113979 TaxID=1176131 RepID=A0A6G1GLS5_9PEZI|nr:hypothetical protein K402DRAFT_221307 [Aulographum hederae CBS 113979]
MTAMWSHPTACQRTACPASSKLVTAIQGPAESSLAELQLHRGLRRFAAVGNGRESANDLVSKTLCSPRAISRGRGVSITAINGFLKQVSSQRFVPRNGVVEAIGAWQGMPLAVSGLSTVPVHVYQSTCNRRRRRDGNTQGKPGEAWETERSVGDWDWSGEEG